MSIVIPSWAWWATGMLPFAMALIARRYRLVGVWWISVTLLTEFLAFGLAVQIIMHRWAVVVAILVLGAVSCSAWAWPWDWHHRV